MRDPGSGFAAAGVSVIVGREVPEKPKSLGYSDTPRRPEP